MSAKAKFLFDQDFAPAAKAEKPVGAAEHALMLAQAEARGFQLGYAAGQQDATAAAAQQTAAAFGRVAMTLEHFAQGVTAAEQRIERESIELALAIARKIVPELMARQPFGEIEALVTECFRQLTSAPHVVVRVNDAQLETAREQLTEIARTRGFDGRLVVLAEPEIALGDCKIEWADGGVVRDLNKIDEAVATAIARYLGARPQPLMPELGGIT